MGLFDRVGLRTDVGKTVSMIIQPLYTVRKHSDTDYEQLIRGGVYHCVPITSPFCVWQCAARDPASRYAANYRHQARCFWWAR